MEIELSRIVRAVRRFWWIALAMAVAFGAVAAGIGAIGPKTYTSDSLLLVVPTSDLVGNADTIIELASSQRVLGPILVEQGIEQSAEDFANDHVRAFSVPGTSIVRIEVTYSDPQVAADITNEIAASVSKRSFDVGLGVLQRNLNNLVYERDQINIQLATVTTQIDQMNAQTADLSSEEQIQLDQLQADLLHLEQRRSDIEGGIRSAEREVATFVEPVMVSDAAVPASESDEISPVILGAVGLVLGALVGAAIMLWMELRDPKVRDDYHLQELTGSDSVMRLGKNDVDPQESASFALIASRISGLARSTNASNILLVSPRQSKNSEVFADNLSKAPQLAQETIVLSTGLLEDAAGLSDITASSTAIVIVEQNQTSNQDVLDVVEALRDLGVPSIRNVLLV